MKNLFSLIVLTSFIFLTSCTKEELFDTSTNPIEAAEPTSKAMVAQAAKLSNPTAESRSGSNPVPVTKISSAVEGSTLAVVFSTAHNFTDANIEATQNLDFTDANGNTVSLTFSVSSYSGSDGAITVSYAIGGNNLGGLDLGDTQIVIEDIMVD